MSMVSPSELLVRLIIATGELGEKAPDRGLVTTDTGLLLMYLGERENVYLVNAHDNKHCVLTM